MNNDPVFMAEIKLSMQSASIMFRARMERSERCRSTAVHFMTFHLGADDRAAVRCQRESAQEYQRAAAKRAVYNVLRERFNVEPAAR